MYPLDMIPVVLVESVSAEELDGWVRVMRRMRRVDPKRFAALLAIADEVVAAHDDPIGERAASEIQWRTRGES